MEPLLITDIAESVNARVFGEPKGGARDICTDTREGAEGALFFALRGEHGDGHAYVQKAFHAGAVAAVVERPVEGAVGPLLIVRDALAALGDLAGWYRSRFDIPVVAVTGSVGKTSTKEMITCALGGRMRVHTNTGNYNNEIGVPLTLFGIDGSHQAVVIEMAMRGLGQIARLCEIARPTIGVVTNIGVSHMELLGSRDAIAAAKAELLESLPADGFAILNQDDDYADFLAGHCACTTLTFGIHCHADYRAENVSYAAAGEPRFTISDQEFALPVAGVHHVINAAAACAVAGALEIPLEDVADRLARFAAPSMRMEVIHSPHGVTILNDSYNAAPDSMAAALETLGTLAWDGRRTVAILGSMKELGHETMAAHRKIGELAAAQDISLLITVGEDARSIAETAIERLGPERIRSFDTTQDAAAEVRTLVLPGDAVLVKGSRAMAMESIVTALVSIPTQPDPRVYRCQ